MGQGWSYLGGQGHGRDISGREASGGDRPVQGRGGVLLRERQGQVQVKNGRGRREARRVVVVSSKYLLWRAQDQRAMLTRNTIRVEFTAWPHSVLAGC